MQKFIYLFVLIFVYSINITAQNYKFGKVSKSELYEDVCPLDKEAHACILYKKRNTHFDYDERNGFIIKEEFHFRIKIYDKEGLEEGIRSIPVYYNDKDSEKVINLRGITYNLKKGKVVKTKLNKKNVYLETTNEHIKQYKFSMPDIKPGSIIEFKYTVKSPFFSELEKVVIQYDIPVKKEDIRLSIPDFFRYRLHYRGNFYYQLKLNKVEKNYKVKDESTSTMALLYKIYTYKENVYDIHTGHVPALKKEAYAGNIENYRTSIIFELAVVAIPGHPRKDYAITWEDVVKDAYEDEKFGKQLLKWGYLSASLSQFKDKPNDEEKLKSILEWAKRKIVWNNEYDYYVKTGVEEAYRNGSGNVGEVNINLINMLKASGFEVHPVLVSTVEHGIPVYPTRTGFNYVIAAVKLHGKQYLLDATDMYSNLEVLPERVLNYEGRLINYDGSSESVNLFPRTHTRKISTVNIDLDEDELTGTASILKDKYFAYETRKKIAGTGEDSQKTYLDSKYENLEIDRFRINNLDNPYKKIKIDFAFTTDAYVEDISGQLYILPLTEWHMESNPFSSETREYPVMFNYPRIISTTVNITIPEDYEIVSVPSPALYTFGEQKGGYEYNIKQNGNKIVVKSTYVINTPVVSSDLYPDLKSFMDKVIQKQKEKIVLQKKN